MQTVKSKSFAQILIADFSLIQGVDKSRRFDIILTSMILFFRRILI